MKRLVALAALTLSGCAIIELPQVDPSFHGLPANADPHSFQCCWNPERHPKALVEVALAVAPAVTPFSPTNFLPEYPGLLTGQTAAQAEITRRLRPLDIVLMANKSSFDGRLVPGRFTHSAVYLGTEAELRAVGLWNTPAFVPLHDEIRAGKVLIEAFRPKVRLTTAQKLFQTDAVALVRPTLSLAQRRQAGLTLVSRLGVPFDYEFDDRTPDKLSCTELIGLAMPSLDFTIRTSYGRPAAMPDDVVAQAIRGERMRLLAQVRGLPEGGYVVEDWRGPMRDIGAFWGLAPPEEASP